MRRANAVAAVLCLAFFHGRHGGAIVKIGIGLPSTVPDTAAVHIVEWARSAERAGFSTLGTLDRLVYGNYDPIPVLAAAAVVTERIGLTTSVLVAPCRGNGAVLAKQLASIDRLSAGRLTAGVAVGTRRDDYEVAEIDYETRGHAQDALLMRMTEIWAHDGDLPVGPSPERPGGPELLIGGGGAATLRRVTRHGAGWISGGGDPQSFAETAQSVRTAWQEAGREGSPRLVSLGYFALGDGADRAAEQYLGDYYGFSGRYAESVIAAAMTSPQQVRDTVAEYADSGCDELILFPCLADPGQVDALAGEVATHLSPRC